MNSQLEGAGTRPCWFVGAAYGGKDDQTSRFLKEGVWENGNTDQHLEEVKSIQPGDRIAIKATYMRKKGLPFDNHGNPVSVMAIKAIGTVTENLGDGRQVKVEWTKIDPPKEWYFYTYLKIIWKVSPGEWMADALIRFTFENVPQDYKEFCNSPFWAGRFGDRLDKEQLFKWTRFYEEMANKLLTFRNRRDELISGIHAIGKKVDCMSILNDQYQKNIPGGPLKDICPFTVMGTFNRGITDANRKIIASELASLLGVSEPVPSSFEGIPILNNQRTWFFGYSYKRQPDDIEALWEVFAQAIAFSDSVDPEARKAFAAAYDNVSSRWGVGWNLTMGLYWIRPWSFPTLEERSQHYIGKKLNIQIGMNGPKGRCNGNDYLAVLENLLARFAEDTFPVHSFPELSYAAWRYKDVPGTPKPPEGDSGDDEGIGEEETPVVTPLPPYSIEDILADGCFLERARLLEILERLRTKKNIILQGPPGTGKTWLAKRLAYALMDERNESRLRAVQFHPNLSYEDFVRGWRPEGDGKLSLVDGPFMEMVNTALKEPKVKHVMVIEEINRGNPAQIFGEILTLLEADKRTPAEALELCYRKTKDETVYVPANLYVIGTMNIADRSLALVDFALRRRFAFINLAPVFGKAWHDWVLTEFKIASEILIEIEKRMLLLNKTIASDTNLGAQFQVGHSFVTPPTGAHITDARQWFRQVAKTEIGPLLDEYWFDNLDKSHKVLEQLLEGF